MIQPQKFILKHLHHHIFLACFLMGYLTLIMFEFYHVLVQGRTFDLLLD